MARGTRNGNRPRQLSLCELLSLTLKGTKRSSTHGTTDLYRSVVPFLLSYSSCSWAYSTDVHGERGSARLRHAQKGPSRYPALSAPQY